MAAKIELKKITTWQEKEDGVDTGIIRFYISNILLGIATPVRNKEEIYSFENCLDYHIVRFNDSENLTLEDIHTHIECSLKEFLKKIAKITHTEETEVPCKDKS